jgi:hypothetical protein
VAKQLEEQFGPENMQQAIVFIQNNKHNQVTSTYYLLLKKLERETGKNYVFEQVTRDKKRNLYSTSNLSSVNFGSPQTKLQTPAKLVMHQTVVGGFNRGVVTQTTKSEGKAQGQPATKKYLEQMEKIYTKRTESTGQTRISDSISNYNTQVE